MGETNYTGFAPLLYIKNGITNIDFYTNAFDAVEIRRWSNDNGSLHVAELAINNLLFHVHEESARSRLLSPESCQGSTVVIGLFVPDVDIYMAKAEAAGATVIMPATDYDYGYRQGEVKDPFGHIWMIQKKI